MMKKQLYRPTSIGPHNSSSIRNLGQGHPDGICYRNGRGWRRYQVCHQDTFSLVALEGCLADESISYTRQEDFIKISFWLSGKHTTVLDGYGQYDHDRPEVFITAGPWDMIKMDIMSQGTHGAAVALCLLPEFFTTHMGLGPDQLPEPLAGIVQPKERPFSFHAYPLTPDLVTAARAILEAPFDVRRQPLYGQAKATELMCLLINRMASGTGTARARSNAHRRQEARLHEARNMLAKRYAEPITLEQISKEVGLNKMALTSGFRQLFGMSVYDCLQKERMDHAYELLQDQTVTIARVAEAVGYGHSCNFSTAFRARFGCTPQEARANRR